MHPRVGDGLVEVLVATFFDDPLYVWLYSDESRRADALRTNFDLILGLGYERGVVDVVDQIGVAVWTERGVSLLDDPAPFVDLLQRWAPGRVESALAGMEACAKYEPAEAMVLHLIGVHPEHRSRGVGSELLRPRLDELQVSKTVGHLQSSNPTNVSFYERLGFEVDGVVPIPDGPSMFPMTRRPT
jgi:ribosomal protein S18 acetylase RimI-like enzyme